MEDLLPTLIMPEPEPDVPGGKEEPGSPLAVPLAVVAAAWKTFDLESRRAQLDEVCRACLPSFFNLRCMDPNSGAQPRRDDA